MTDILELNRTPTSSTEPTKPSASSKSTPSIPPPISSKPRFLGGPNPSPRFRRHRLQSLQSLQSLHNSLVGAPGAGTWPLCGVLRSLPSFTTGARAPRFLASPCQTYRAVYSQSLHNSPAAIPALDFRCRLRSEQSCAPIAVSSEARQAQPSPHPSHAPLSQS